MNYFDILLAKKLENDKDVSIVQLDVSENGTYSESGKAYSPVVVDVQPPSNSYLRTPIDSYPTTAEQLPIPKCDVEIANQKLCKVFVSNKPFVNDKVPYLFRKSAGGNNVFEKIIGGTIVTNQMIENGDFSDGLNGWTIFNEGASTITASNNEATITGNTTYNDGVAIELQTTPGHIYYVTASIKSTGNVRFYDGQNIFTDNITSSSDYKRHEHIISVGTLTSQFFILSKQSINTVNIKNVMCIDITRVFGNGAQYIYGLEQATAGAGVAYFRQMFPNDYYAYDTGSLQSVNVASKKVYDSNNTLVATYTFDSDLTLRGLPKLDSNNNLYYDGDVYESDGTVTRKYRVVDLGSLTWVYNSTYKVFYCSDDLGEARKTGVTTICSKYLAVANTMDISMVQNGTCCVYSNSNVNVHRLYVKDEMYTTTSAFKTAMNGVYLVYELATPTTESADAYTNPQIVDADGTEEFVDYAYSQGTRDVAVPVGHDSLYYNGQLYQTDFTQATTDTINMAELHSIVPPSGEFYITSNGTLSVDVWKK